MFLLYVLKQISNFVFGFPFLMKKFIKLQFYLFNLTFKSIWIIKKKWILILYLKYQYPNLRFPLNEWNQSQSKK